MNVKYVRVRLLDQATKIQKQPYHVRKAAQVAPKQMAADIAKLMS